MKKLINYSICLILCYSLFARHVFSKEKAQWIEITLLETNDQIRLNASSALQSTDNVLKGTYGAANVFDQNFSTAWVEGKKGEGIGEALFFMLPEGTTRLNIMNGYSKNKNLYYKNNRARSVKLSFYAGINPEGFVSEIAAIYKSVLYSQEFTITLADTCTVQSFPIPLSWDEIHTFTKETLGSYSRDFDIPPADTAVIIKLEILQVYKGSKWDDTCISEIFFNDVFLYNPLQEKYHAVDSVYVNDAENAVVINTPQKKGIEFFNNPESVLQIIETSADNQWVIVIRMSSKPSSRHQTEYILLNTFLAETMNHRIEQVSGETVTGPFLFNYIGKDLYLEFYPAGIGQSKQILLK